MTANSRLGTIAAGFIKEVRVYTFRYVICFYKFCTKVILPTLFQRVWTHHTHNHWANGQTMKRYIHNIILPHVENVKKEKNLPSDQHSLVILEVTEFKTLMEWWRTTSLRYWRPITPQTVYNL